MERIIYLSSKNPIEFKAKVDDKRRNWYFVNWHSNFTDLEGNYSIYTNSKTFGKSNIIFKSKELKVVNAIGNLINGLFHNYFGISNSYPLEPILNIDKFSINIQAEKLELMKSLLNTENPKVIQEIKRVFQKEKVTDFWEELTSEQQQEINEATSEIERGEITDYETFIAKHRS